MMIVVMTEMYSCLYSGERKNSRDRLCERS